MNAVVHLQPALILQHRHYRESSELLEVFTQDYGIISILAKGVRKEKSKLAGLLQPFSVLRISYLDKNELKVLIQAEYVTVFTLQRLGLYCGFYVNELLLRFLHHYDPHPELFNRYQQCLQELSQTDSIEQTLRYFELDLLMAAGYGVQLATDCLTQTSIQAGLRYDFLAGEGMTSHAAGIVTGNTLQIMANRGVMDATALAEAKPLLRKMLDLHLQGRPLQSRAVLAKIIKYL